MYWCDNKSEFKTKYMADSSNQFCRFKHIYINAHLIYESRIVLARIILSLAVASNDEIVPA